MPRKNCRAKDVGKGKFKGKSKRGKGKTTKPIKESYNG